MRIVHRLINRKVKGGPRAISLSIPGENQLARRNNAELKALPFNVTVIKISIVTGLEIRQQKA